MINNIKEKILRKVYNFLTNKYNQRSFFNLQEDLKNYPQLNQYIMPERLKCVEQRINDGKRYLNYESFFDIFRDEQYLYLGKNKLKFVQDNAINILVNEILINEDYFFECNKDAPKILDCGSNFGLSIFYFKQLFPKSEIIAFEPDPTIRDILKENIQNNEWDNVTLLPYALSDKEEILKFHKTSIDSMAGSLTERRKIHGDKIESIDVETKRLSNYLKYPIDYLKMDIEGSEDLVLEECKDSLKNVHYIFCEYHHGNGLASDRLIKILQIFQNAGFDYQVSKSFSYNKYTQNKPMNYIGNPYSSIIWAKNSAWKDNA